MKPARLLVEPLTRSSFSGFGDVIDTTGRSFPINGGRVKRIHELGTVDCSDGQGRGIISIFQTTGATLPDRIFLLERHPISSQAFIPLTNTPMIVVVSSPSERPTAKSIRAFRTDGTQGVNYARGTWHHPLIALGAGQFLVIDRTGPGTAFDQDYEEVHIDSVALTIDN